MYQNHSHSAQKFPTAMFKTFPFACCVRTYFIHLAVSGVWSHEGRAHTWWGFAGVSSAAPADTFAVTPVEVVDRRLLFPPSLAELALATVLATPSSSVSGHLALLPAGVRRRFPAPPIARPF